MENEPSDEDLMTAYSSGGDAVAFAQLYQRYESKLYGFFLRRLSMDLRGVASDLFQKTWLNVHRARRRYDNSQAFSPWLFSIALNVLRDEWRVPKVIDDEADVESTASTEDVEQGFDLRQDLGRLEKAILRIPEVQREALILSEWEGFSARELSLALGITEAAARQTVSRARKKVRKIMKEDLK